MLYHHTSIFLILFISYSPRLLFLQYFLSSCHLLLSFLSPAHFFSFFLPLHLFILSILVSGKFTLTPPSVERHCHLKPSQRSCPTWLAPPHPAASRLYGLGQTAPQWRAGDGGRWQLSDVGDDERPLRNYNKTCFFHSYNRETEEETWVVCTLRFIFYHFTSSHVCKAEFVDMV